MSDDRPLQVRVAEAYENGAHDIEICKVLRLTPSKFEQYYREDAKFKEVVDLGRTLSKAYWYEQGRTQLQNPKFNNTLWAFNMKNRFGWADKTETVTKDESEESIETLKNKLDKQLPALLRKLYPEMTEAELLTMASNQVRN